MALIYTFTFAPPAAGLTCTIKTTDGTTVHSEAVGSTVGPDGAVRLSVELPEGNYVGSVSDPSFGTWEEVGLLNVPTSLGSNGVGAEQTAFFVARGPAYATDTAGAAGPLTFEPDDRHGALPSWVSLSSGDVVLSEDAGTCLWSLSGLFAYDFSDTTAPDSTGAITATFQVNNPLGQTSYGSDDLGNGDDLQTGSTVYGGGVTVPGTFVVTGLPGAYSDDQITLIEDGTASPRVALTFTRNAQAAVVPDAE